MTSVWSKCHTFDLNLTNSYSSKLPFDEQATTLLAMSLLFIGFVALLNLWCKMENRFETAIKKMEEEYSNKMSDVNIELSNVHAELSKLKLCVIKCNSLDEDYFKSPAEKTARLAARVALCASKDINLRLLMFPDVDSDSESDDDLTFNLTLNDVDSDSESNDEM